MDNPFQFDKKTKRIIIFSIIGAVILTQVIKYPALYPAAAIAGLVIMWLWVFHSNEQKEKKNA